MRVCRPLGLLVGRPERCPAFVYSLRVRSVACGACGSCVKGRNSVRGVDNPHYVNGFAVKFALDTRKLYADTHVETT